MPLTPRRPRLSVIARLLAPLVGVLLGALVLSGATPAQAAPIEEYASWQPGDRCRPTDKPGTAFLADWIVRKYGGGRGGIARACTSSTSEHEEGRAFDWTLDATRKADRRRAAAFMTAVLADGRGGQHHARARRMGLMYVIWNDRMFAAWDRFEPKAYLSSGCTKLTTCSKTLRHRDHLHLSLNRDGGWGRTSFFTQRMPKD